jgi:hypothetical protein
MEDDKREILYNFKRARRSEALFYVFITSLYSEKTRDSTQHKKYTGIKQIEAIDKIIFSDWIRVLISMEQSWLRYPFETM